MYNCVEEPDTTGAVAERIGQYLEHLPMKHREHAGKIAVEADRQALAGAGWSIAPIITLSLRPLGDEAVSS